MALIVVVELLHAIMQGQNVHHSTLYHHIVEHVRLFKRTYGADAMNVKHHHCIHLAEQLQRHGRLFSCWVHERRHQLIRDLCLERKTLVGYEEGMMEDISMHNIQSMQDFGVWLDGGLMEPVYNVSANMHRILLQTFGFAPGAQTVVIARANGGAYMKNDLVIVHHVNALPRWVGNESRR